jgi:hypothetical protein
MSIVTLKHQSALDKRLPSYISKTFSLAARLYVENDQIAYEMVDDTFAEKRGMVYIWVNGNDILYIGKAGKGIRKRLGEHRAGSKIGTGRNNRLLLEQCDGPILVYGRLANEGVKTYKDIYNLPRTEVYTTEAEEESELITLLHPLWNRNLEQ